MLDFATLLQGLWLILSLAIGMSIYRIGFKPNEYHSNVGKVFAVIVLVAASLILGYASLVVGLILFLHI